MVELAGPRRSPKTFGCLTLLWLAGAAWAGAPFITDDPEPVEPGHWEIYLATQTVWAADGITGTAPHLDVNYGAHPEVQVHMSTPLVYKLPRAAGSPAAYGYGDTELGVKWRWVREGKSTPQIGVYPMIELSTGNAARGLGNGKTQFYLPLWLQKSFGRWTAYGGGGYRFNPGLGNRDWWFLGAVVQHPVSSRLTLGAELFHGSSSTVAGHTHTGANLGVMYDASEHQHVVPRWAAISSATTG